MSELRRLKEHNVPYHDVEIDLTRLQQLPERDIVPVHIEQIASSSAQSKLTSRYDDPTLEGDPDDLARMDVDDEPDTVRETSTRGIPRDARFLSILFLLTNVELNLC